MNNSYTFTNFHTHTSFCDGTGIADDFVKEAIARGFRTIGFSSHAPLPFVSDWTMPKERLDEYIDYIQKIKAKYASEMEVYLGLEYDYLGEGVVSGYRHSFDNRLDYTILSVHFLGKYDDGTPWTIDGSFSEIERGIAETFSGDVQKAVETYYTYIGEGCLLLKPDIVGHIDLIKIHNKNNCFFNETADWYKKAAFECLKKIKESGAVMEINTGGILRDLINDFYPSQFLIKEAIALNIPIMVNSDAHAKNHIDGCYDKAFETLRSLGLKEYCISVQKGKHVMEPLR